MDSEETRDQKWERCGDLIPLGEIAERLLEQMEEIQRVMLEFNESRKG